MREIKNPKLPMSKDENWVEGGEILSFRCKIVAISIIINFK